MINRVIELNKLIHEKFPKVKILIGGPHATIRPKETSEQTGADIVITNESNINVFELKKDHLTLSQIPQIEKEMKKHLYYSLFSNRIRQTDTNRFNFYLVTLRDKNNTPFRPIIEDKYWNLCENISTHRKTTITFVEYTVNDSGLSFETTPQ